MTHRHARGFLRGLSLRGRFALLSAVAVSVAIIVAALASYFLVSEQLNNQVNQNVSKIHPLGGRFSATGVAAYDQCLQQSQYSTGLPPGGNPDPGPGGPANPFNQQYVLASGKTCATGDLAVSVSETQKAIAAGTLEAPQLQGVFYDTYSLKGEHVRVYTYTYGDGVAISNIATLSDVDSSLSKLTLWLAVAAVSGVALATMAGLLVARSAVKPVRRLTRAVEHVAKTEDLSIKLPVEGRDEINRLSAAFNKMTKALATSRVRQHQLIADAGHELRTPLTSLRTNVDLLLRSERTGRELPPGRRETMLASVDQQLHELSGLVTDLLELSRGQEGGARRTMRVALHESVGRAIERAKLRGPGLYFDIEVEPWYVQGDPTALDRAVVNLLDNAVKFSPAGGTVMVRLKGGEYAVVDQGPGIDPADLPHVFERFWRSDSARSLPGSGLGLAIVSQVAEESGGKVSLQPAPGGGTVARLWLPGDPGAA
ncbi:MAG TPA: HAMP domain-containing sensor histidine kinase [Actinocrinis sp.]|uniref:sensor histidine kinase n=2 Tax=Actinocrinis sp. TaxID=1920516 RepID=UPI002D25B232|nr:HAMP domain-containing sensor histidine kinase [Actinocrinis sp.]HZU54498.1 HAMP domain-containing sensor histidine kinase [Actinocrinis sp.]